MNEQDTAVRLRQIELRLSRIEQLLDLAPPSTALGRVQRETPVAAPALPVEPAILSPAAPVPDISISVARSAPPAPTEPHKPPAPRPAGTPLEVLIGERWMAWVGAVVVVVAVGFFVKLAYDLGWWARLTPSIKCLVAATFGFLLLAGGELALRKIGRAAAVSLFAAGLGTLYVTAYATFRFFDLLPQTGAFWLMAVVALLGLPSRRLVASTLAS